MVVLSSDGKKLADEIRFSKTNFSVKAIDLSYPDVLREDAPVTTNLVIVKDQKTLDAFLSEEATSAIESEISLEQQTLAFDFKTTNEAKQNLLNE